MKNIITPRTLAECQFHVGHASIEHPHHRPSGTLAERVYGVLLATVLGIVGAAALVHFWSS